MGKLSELFRTFGPEYLATYGTEMPAAHRKALRALMACRTDACGVVGYTCTQCGEPHWTFRSCGNRHCPQCQHAKGQAWLAARLQQALPGHHFLLTFTVPEALRPFLRSHQRAGYGALFAASADAIKTLARDARHLGGDLPGFFGVLHTWGRQLTYHPHIHYVVPGGAVSTQDGAWHPSRVDFYLPVFALSQVYRAKFRDAMHRLGLFDAIPDAVWAVDWNVNCQAVGESEASLTVPRALRVPRRHHRQPHHQGREPHRLVPLSQTPQPAVAHPGAGCAGVHPTLPPARPADGVHEDPLLRVPQCQLRHPAGAPGRPHRVGLRLHAHSRHCRGPRAAPAAAVPAVRRAADLPLDSPPRSPLAIAVGAASGASTTRPFPVPPGRLTAGWTLPVCPLATLPASTAAPEGPPQRPGHWRHTPGP